MAESTSFSLSTFVAEVNNRNLARPSRFEVYMRLPTSVSQFVGADNNRVLSLFCESANLPSQSVGVKQQRIYGPTYQKPFSIDYGGEGISLTFLLDGKMNIKALFDNWVSKVVDPVQYFVYYPHSYVSEIEIFQLDEQNNVTYSVTLEDAFPRNVSMLELNQGAQNQVHKLNVTFAYRRWIPRHNLTNSMRYPPLDLRYRQEDPTIRTPKSVRATQNALEKAQAAGGAENAVEKINRTTSKR